MEKYNLFFHKISIKFEKYHFDELLQVEETIHSVIFMVCSPNQTAILDEC